MGHQPGFASSALQETADVRVADPYIYVPALVGRLSASAADRAGAGPTGDLDADFYCITIRDLDRRAFCLRERAEHEADC